MGSATMQGDGGQQSVNVVCFVLLNPQLGIGLQSLVCPSSKDGQTDPPKPVTLTGCLVLGRSNTTANATLFHCSFVVTKRLLIFSTIIAWGAAVALNRQKNNPEPVFFIS